MIEDQNLEKQMGCMSGFLQIFDRNQIINGKRLYTTKRLPPSPEMYSTSQSEKSVESPMFSTELVQQQQQQQVRSVSPVKQPLPVFEGVRSSWKFREAPRLSLDSRANVDAKGSIYPKENAPILSAVRRDNSGDSRPRSPSVIGKLMGLEALPNDSCREPIKKAELRRSASESRVSKDIYQYRNIDGNSFQVKQPHQAFSGNVSTPRTPDSANISPVSSTHYWKSQSHQQQQQQQQQQRKSFFDSQDFYPEPKQTECFYGEIEKRLKMRGINEPVKDLEALKQILEVLQLKGLLHSKQSPYDDESPIVVMKPARSLSPNFRSKSVTTTSPQARPRRDRFDIVDRSPVTDNRRVRNRDIDQRSSDDRSPSSLARRRMLSVETQKNSPVSSPKFNSRKNVSDQVITTITNRSPRNRKSAAEVSPKQRTFDPIESDSSSISSQIGPERSKMEGKSLLERCDRLLHSIAEFTTAELQPSPVSVLDSSLYKDELSPSPVTKRCIDFRDGAVELNDENRRGPMISPVRLNFEDKSGDPDFLYVSKIVKASSVSEDTNVFLLLEKQYYKTNSSQASQLHRKLVFDTVTEICNKKKQSPPWKPTNSILEKSKSSFETIWSELQRIRDSSYNNSPVEDLTVNASEGCGDNSAVKLNAVLDIERLILKDMAVDTNDGWGDSSAETLHAVLDIERLIFKDLVGETLWDLVGFARKNRITVSRRKLVF